MVRSLEESSMIYYSTGQRQFFCCEVVGCELFFFFFVRLFVPSLTVLLNKQIGHIVIDRFVGKSYKDDEVNK